MDTPMDEVRQLLPMLSARQKLLLISDIARELLINPPVKQPHATVIGILADLGPGPSEEDFEEARRAMFPALTPEQVGS